MTTAVGLPRLDSKRSTAPDDPRADHVQPYRRTYSSIKMMVGSAFFGLGIVAVGIVRSASIIMLAKLSNTINGKCASSMKLLLRTSQFSHFEVASIGVRSQI